MSGQKPLRRTPEEALSWHREFYEEHGRIASNSESNKLRGPTWKLIQKLGGKCGIVEALGLTPEYIPTNHIYSAPQLLNSLSEWVVRQGIDKTPRSADAIKAFESGDLIIASFDTYWKRFGSWDNALAGTGYFRFEWEPSECVGSAYRAKQKFPYLDTVHAIRRYSQRGVTPLLKDTLAHYSSIKELTLNRLGWDIWQEPTTKLKTRRNKISTVSYGVLALATAKGVIGDFEQAHETLYKEDRGPEFSRDLYSNLAPDHMSEKAGFVWALDFIERAHQFAVDKRGDSRLSVKDLHIGAVSRRELVHPTFMPELAELKAA